MCPELKPQEAAYSMSLIGILHWTVEIERVDMCLDVSMMSSHLSLPRQGHLSQVFRTFSYLKNVHSTGIVFDPSDHVIDHTIYDRNDRVFSEIGHVIGKETTPSMHEPRGMVFVIHAKVDIDHAGDIVTGRYRIGFFVYFDSSSIQ